MSKNTHDGDVGFIKALAELLRENDLTELEVIREYGEDDSLNVRVARQIHAAPVAIYTVDDYSFHNLGFGFSMQLSKLNLYTTFDNILNYGNITKTNNVSFQFGANIIFN